MVWRAAELFRAAAQHMIELRRIRRLFGAAPVQPRRIQATLKPKALAPVMSKLFDETNSTSSFGTSSSRSTSA